MNEVIEGKVNGIGDRMWKSALRHKDRRWTRRAFRAVVTSSLVVVPITMAWASSSSWASKHNPGPFGAPQEVAFTPTDAWITDPARNAVVEVNSATGHIVRRVQGRQGRFETPVQIAANSTDLWVHGEGPSFAHTIAELNSSNGAFVRSLALRGGNLAVCGGHLWSVGGSDYFEFSVTSGKLQRVVDLGKKGIWLGGELTVEGNELWDAGGEGRANVAVELSCSTGAVSKVLHIGDSAEDVGGIALDGDHLWITTGSVLVAAAVREFNTTSGALIREIRSAQHDFYDGSIAATGNVVCILSHGGANVALVDGSTGSLVKTVSSALFVPEIQVVAADGGDFWLLNTEGSAVIVINAKTGKIVHYLGTSGRK